MNLGLLPKADQGWRAAAHRDQFGFTRDYSATLPSHWAQQVLDLPVSTRSIQRPYLQTAAAVPRVLSPPFRHPPKPLGPTSP
jgi:hypothetical protein